jgi:hypothetical protein
VKKLSRNESESGEIHRLRLNRGKRASSTESLNFFINRRGYHAQEGYRQIDSSKFCLLLFPDLTPDIRAKVGDG